jgi:hypothetical protein
MRACVEAEEFGVAARRRNETEHRTDRRRLAGAVRAEEAEDAATAHFDVERIDGRALPVALRQLDGAQDDIGRCWCGCAGQARLNANLDLLA